jgi:hypothetical protein
MEAAAMEPTTAEAAHSGGRRRWCESKADEGRCQDRNQGSHWDYSTEWGRPQSFLTS